jgi:hypothetical protein
MTTINIIVASEGMQRQPRSWEGRRSNVKESIGREMQPQTLIEKKQQQHLPGMVSHDVTQMAVWHGPAGGQQPVGHNSR